MEHPQCEDCLGGEAATERVEAEECRESIHNTTRLRCESRICLCAELSRVVTEASIREEHDDAAESVQHKARLTSGLIRVVQRTGNPCGHAGTQCADGTDERTHQCVAGKERGTVRVVHGCRCNALLQWQERTHVAGTGVHGGDHADDGEEPERAAQSEGHSGDNHDPRGKSEESLGGVTVRPYANTEREHCRAQKTRGDHGANLQSTEAQVFQVRGQHHKGDAIYKCPDAAREQHDACIERG